MTLFAKRKAEAACSGATGIRQIAQEGLPSGAIWLMTRAPSCWSWTEKSGRGRLETYGLLDIVL
ncbi:hypothetical protein [Robertmurraya korlensis]|uniref:hypothetical protein n=1 Tax=Robertmurraya korlensis TaxID=519977 RepID=UPI0012ECC782|nr:hypothetical protein [Robertmurraya korlensis]